jgi:magnesium-protoporphyrin IX monomethyl ester (oxidative) cyclase
VTIFYEVKADLSAEQLATLAGAGVTEVQPGIEALSTSTLRLMKKGTTSFQNIAFLMNCVRHAIHPAWNLLIGFPGEDENVYRKYVEDIPRLTHLPPPGGTFPVRFDRYSPYFTHAGEYGLRLAPYDSYELIYPWPAADLADLAYFFADQNYTAPYMHATAKWIRPLQAAVERWRCQWQQGDSPRLQWVVRDGLRVVQDTRQGQHQQWQLSEGEAQLLRRLDKPLDRARLAASFPELVGEELDRLIAACDQRGLLFQESGRWMSLVIDEPAATPGAVSSGRSQLANAPTI